MDFNFCIDCAAPIDEKKILCDECEDRTAEEIERKQESAQTYYQEKDLGDGYGY